MKLKRKLIWVSFQNSSLINLKKKIDEFNYIKKQKVQYFTNKFQ